MEKVARQQIYKMIPTKIHTNEGTDFKNQNNAQPWLMIKPESINWSFFNDTATTEIYTIAYTL
eukprot:COSAG02_NODE_55383_length_291_cov_0.296875_1_plen_62_part_10